MISSELFLTLALLVLLSIFTRGQEYMGERQQNPNKPKRQKTRSDLFTFFLLILTVFTQLYYAILSPPPNAFRVLGGMPIRNSTGILRAVLLGRNSALSDKDQLLLDKFQSRENRLIYATYGEEALLECTYCKEVTDYFYFIVPTIIWSYITMSIILGVSTIVKRKVHLRTYGIILLLGCAFVELYTLASAGVKGDAVDDTAQFVYSTTDFCRRCAFSILCVAVLFFDKVDERSNVDILQEVIRDQALIIERNKVLNIQRAAVLRDENLRKIFEDFYKGKETEYNEIDLDPEYKEAKEKSLQKVKPEKLKELNDYIDNITKMRDINDNSSQDDANRNPS